MIAEIFSDEQNNINIVNGVVLPKMKILKNQLLAFQTYKTSVHLWNTNENIFN